VRIDHGKEQIQADTIRALSDNEMDQTIAQCMKIRKIATRMNYGHERRDLSTCDDDQACKSTMHTDTRDPVASHMTQPTPNFKSSHNSFACTHLHVICVQQADVRFGNMFVGASMGRLCKGSKGDVMMRY
jgi:hypothetical protein